MESGMQTPLLHGQESGTTTFIWKLYDSVLPAHVENTVKNDDKVALCHQQRPLDTGRPGHQHQKLCSVLQGG